MSGSRRTEIVMGLVVPLVIVAVLAILSFTIEVPGIAVAFMATAPLIAAMFTRALFTAIVSGITVVAAAVCIAAGYPLKFISVAWIVLGVVIAAAIAVIASQAKAAPAPRASSGGASASSPNGPQPMGEATEQTDGLTGLPNREGLKAMLAADASAGRRTIAIIDADHLVVVNDTYGRQVGDTFLFAVAGRTRYALPEGDIVARWGDEEFVVVTKAAPGEVMDLLTLITDKVNQNFIRTDAGLIPQTISVGAAAWPEGMSFEDAFDAARRAMYQAKAEGGARLVAPDVAA